jgi:ParB family chromosome partitioning protein
MTGAILAKRLGRSRADIVNTVRLLDLPDDAVELIDSGALSKGHGKALLAEPDHHRRRVLARRAAESGWSVRTLEAEIARIVNPREPRPSPHPDRCAAAAKLQDAIVNATGCEARAAPHRRGFQIILDHAAADRLARVLGGDTTAL